MKHLLMSVFFALGFYVVGVMAERAQVPPFNLMPANYAPIAFAVVGLGVGFWLGYR